MALGGLVKLLGEIKLFSTYWEKFIVFTKQTVAGTKFDGQGGMMLGTPGISPAYIGVGYIIGPRLASLNFSGGVIAWGLLTPMILYFLAPSFDLNAMASALMSTDSSLTSECCSG